MSQALAEDLVAKLCAHYVNNVKAYALNTKVERTGEQVDPDEAIMRAVEVKLDVVEGRKAEFRRELLNFIAGLAIQGRTFDSRTNPRLRFALESIALEYMSARAGEG